MPTIRRILIANRGEIAVRIARTCRELGIESVAVYSDADADAPHVRAADLAVHIGPAPSRESYLSIERLLAAAATTGADAVHPGYGFLSENAAFAEAVEAAGLIFIGPSAEAIRLMGSKQRAKRIAVEAGVPVVPGYHGEAQDDASLLAAASDIGFPLLVKASAGGGGKGMRIVRAEAELAEAIAAARGEAERAFGDPTLLIERYVERPRHVEIQILGDRHGNLVHVFERECSIQRRHQKIVEESPSPALDDGLRALMGQAAVRLAAAIGYHGAGTVEFVLAPHEGGPPDGARGAEFFFLEVNTRLQVEHPVTELVSGLDLVREQIRIAEGARLAVTQDALQPHGHAVECRLYAEEPATGFMPCTGVISDWHLEPLEGVRLDAGVETGTEVGIHYDPMLAKLIAHGPDRASAIRRARYALSRLSIGGVTTNRDALIGILDHPEFLAGRTDTHFLEHHLDALDAAAPSADTRRRAAIAATLAAREQRRLEAPLSVPSGWRNNPSVDQHQAWTSLGETIEVRYRGQRDGSVTVRCGPSGADPSWAGRVQRVSWDAPELRYEDADGVLRRYRVIVEGSAVQVLGPDGAVGLRALPRFPERDAETPVGGATAPMPGKVLEVRVGAGARVDAGQVLVVLEAMKMQHSVLAARDGVVAEVRVAVGDQVEADQVLLRLEDEEDVA